VAIIAPLPPISSCTALRQMTVKAGFFLLEARRFMTWAMM
jgi:hypothetical protein